MLHLLKSTTVFTNGIFTFLKKKIIFFLKRLVRARQQRRRYLEYKLKVATAQRAVRHWLARRHKAATVIQQAVWKFLLLSRQKRVQQGILKAQVVSAECGKDVACNSKGESRRFPIQSIFRCPKFIQPSVTSVRTAH